MTGALVFALRAKIRLLMVVLLVIEVLHGPLHGLEGGQLDALIEHTEWWLMSMLPMTMEEV
jgi:hypothetical protein